MLVMVKECSALGKQCAAGNRLELFRRFPFTQQSLKQLITAYVIEQRLIFESLLFMGYTPQLQPYPWTLYVNRCNSRYPQLPFQTKEFVGKIHAAV